MKVVSKYQENMLDLGTTLRFCDHPTGFEKIAQNCQKHQSSIFKFFEKKKSLPNNMIFWYNFACQFIVVLSIAYQKSKKCPACGPNLEMAAWTQKVAIFPSSGNPNCQFDT